MEEFGVRQIVSDGGTLVKKKKKKKQDNYWFEHWNHDSGSSDNEEPSTILMNSKMELHADTDDEEA